MKKIIVLFILCCSLKNISAQMLKPETGYILRERYDSSITLKKGDYIVQSDVVFAKTALLTIEPGVRIFFSPGATMKINGGLHANGEPNNLIQFSSAGGRESGTGLVIGSSSPDADIKITYSSFKFLIKPLEFIKDWYRKGVEITNSDFFNTYEFNDAVSVREVEFYLNKQPLDFVFRNNVFADNYSNITITNATSYRVRYLFEKNVFANNLYFDNRTKVESNPLYVGLDDIQGKYTMKVYDNAFSDNYILSQDSLKLLNLGTIGFLHPKSDFIIENNFLKHGVDKKYIQKDPNFNLHAFPMELSINGKNISQDAPIDSLAGKSIKILFNTSIAPSQKDYKVYFNFIDTISGDILKIHVDKNYTFAASSGNAADFSFTDSILTQPIGYISIENLKNRDGVTVPSVNLGLLDFFKRCGNRSYKMDYVTLQPKDIQQYNSKLVDTTKNIITEIDSVKFGKWEVGIFGGVSGYAGDLNHDWFNQEKWNKAFGLKIRYHINRNIAARLSVDFTNVQATDYGLYGPRKLRFKSKIISGFVMGEYSFSDKYSSNRHKGNTTLGKKLYPTFGIGVGLVKFNPMGQYTDSNWYPLRQYGTEGQTAPGGKQYSTLALTTPFMAGINYRITKNLKVAVEFTAFKLYTDYLDDASKVSYVDDGIIRAANPGNEDIASYFRNPGVDLGARGNPNDRDFFYNIGFSIWYRFNHKKDRDEER
ncbi:hypothetical protein LK994_13965 [Ferruginibacter lapsinanis]|uniref:hypothetical protein n=1 Tax=Ferruginibacter lapsinanis TaxID=563172 RepID=UPI001E5621C0|nr:hypothetical protein [Ferruginibacter lapsinanis]UEG49743.1 hypothetical protein LK994_13965 [Ferruginibacter lapsinanis]